MTRVMRKRISRKRTRNDAMARMLVPVLVIVLVAGLLALGWQRDLFGLRSAWIAEPIDASFESWLDREPGRAEEYAALQSFLREQGVGEVVPVWQLARVDREYAEKCNLDIWRIPPRELWPNVVPALRLVREHVIPAVGPVEVQSSYRTPELNECARGAPRSKHTSFEALDLWLATPPQDLDALYRGLCAMQERAGRNSRMGLGAYYDPNDPDYNPEGRFHIDAGGYRSWGRSYTRATSLCPRDPQP